MLKMLASKRPITTAALDSLCVLRLFCCFYSTPISKFCHKTLSLETYQSLQMQAVNHASENPSGTYPKAHINRLVMWTCVQDLHQVCLWTSASIYATMQTNNLFHVMHVCIYKYARTHTHTHTLLHKKHTHRVWLGGLWIAKRHYCPYRYVIVHTCAFLLVHENVPVCAFAWT